MAQLHFGDEEARRALADVDQDRFAANTQGEGYGGFGDDKDTSFNPPPPRDGQPPIPVHHQRNDPLTAGKPSPVVPTGFEPFEAKPEDAGEVFPPAPGYGNFEDKQEEAVRAVPPSGYGRQPDEVAMLKDEGYTSLGIQESQDSENSTGVLSGEGINSVKEREGTAPYEPVAKELEDHPVRGGGIAADVPPVKKDSLDLPKGDTDDVRKTEAAPQGSLGNVERQQEDRDDGPQGSFENALQEQEGKEGIHPEALGFSKDGPVEREGDVPYQAAVAQEPVGGSATGSRGIDDVQALKGPNVDIPEASSQEPDVVDDAAEGDRKDEAEAADPISEAGHVDTSHFTSQIKSPVDDPKQRYAVDDPIQEFSVDDTEQKQSRPDSSKLEDFSDLSQEPRTDDPRKEEAPISDPKSEYPVDLRQKDSFDDLNQEKSVDDVKKSPADPIHEDSIASPTHAVDEMGDREAAPQAGLLGNAEQQEDQKESYSQRSFENSQEQGERDGTPLGALEFSKDEQKEREGAAPDQTAFAEEPEDGSSTGSRGVVDVQSLKEGYVELSEASPKEPNSVDDPMGVNSTDKPVPHQSAIVPEEPEDGSAPGSRGIIDVDSSKASTKEPNLVDDSMEGKSTNEPFSHQAAMAEEPEDDSTGGSRGIIDVQSLKEDYVDLSEADTKGPTPVDGATEGSITNEPIPHQSTVAEEPEDGSATESRGIIDVQSLKQDYVDLSETNTKEHNVAAEDSLGSNSQPAMVEEPEGGSLEGSRGIIDVQSMNEDYVDLAEAARNEPKSVEEDMEATSTSEPKVDDSIPDLKEGGLKQKSPIDGLDQENSDAGHIPASSLRDSNAVQDSIVESSTGDDRELELAEVAKPEQSKQPQATDDDIHGCERFQGDNGKEKILAEGYNIYSGEPENKVYDAADVIGDEHEKATHETEADVAVEPTKVSSAKGEASPGANAEDASAGDAPADDKFAYTDVFKIDSSDIQQGVGFEPDLKDREDGPAAINKEEDATHRENGENEPAGEEFPNTEFAPTGDYVKVGHGEESSVPTQNEEVGTELKSPSERVGQQEERRPTDEHPLDKPVELDNVAEQEEIYKVDVPKRPPSLPHPQGEDMAAAMNNKTGGIGDDEQQHHEDGPQKKGIFAKIKEKLSPTYASH